MWRAKERFKERRLYSPSPVASRHGDARGEIIFAVARFWSFETRSEYVFGKTVSREFKAGDVIFVKGQSHIGENIGETDTNVVIVEPK